MVNTSRIIPFWLNKLRPLSPTLRLALVAGTLAVASVSAQAPLDIRVALIIGNSAYVGAPVLGNPANDARAMSEVLRSLGFSVIELRDGNRVQMAAAITKVSAALKDKQGVGMLYYAGHGLQLDWHNYMVPVDARLKNAADVPVQAIDLGAVIDAFKSAGNRMNIVVLDACRDNPFASSTSSAKGLAQLDAPPGTFLAYATAPGNVAEDGDEASGNGLYTQYLLQELKKPIAKIEDVFKRVRLNVRKQSQGRQIPWESTSLEDDFYFNDGVKFTIQPEELARMAAVLKARAQQRLAQEAAQEAQARERERQLALQVTQERERQQAQVQALEVQRLAVLVRAKEAERLGAEARARAQEILAAETRFREQQRLADATRLAELNRLAALVKVPVPDKKLIKDELKELAFREEKAAWALIKTSNKPDDFYAFLERYPSAGELGDEYVIQSSDILTNVPGQRQTARVTRIEGDDVQFNGGATVLTALGAAIKNARGRFDPPFAPRYGSIPDMGMQSGGRTSRVAMAVVLPAVTDRNWLQSRPSAVDSAQRLKQVNILLHGILA